LAALAGFVFTAATEASGVERCPYHDGVPVQGAEASAEAAPEHQAHNGHGAHGAAASADFSAGGSHESHEGGCSCLGQCGTSSAPPLPRAAALAVKLVVTASVTPQPSSDSSVSHRTGGLFLRHRPTAPPVTV
jgi:hypothetical protein